MPGLYQARHEVWGALLLPALPAVHPPSQKLIGLTVSGLISGSLFLLSLARSLALALSCSHTSSFSLCQEHRDSWLAR